MKPFSTHLWKPMKHQTQTMKKAARSVAAIMFASLMGVSPALIADGANARSNEKKRFDMSVFSTFPSPFEDNIPTPGRNVTPLEFCMEILGKEDKERLKRCHLYFRGPREPTTLYHNQAFYI